MQAPIPAPPPPPDMENPVAEEREQTDDDGVKLPVALEQALALKSVREKMESGVTNEIEEGNEKDTKSEITPDTELKAGISLLKKQLSESYKEEDNEYDEDDENDDADSTETELKTLSKTQTRKAQKAKKRRKRKKKKKKVKNDSDKENSSTEPVDEKSDKDDKANNASVADSSAENKDDLNVEVEYVQEILSVNQLAPMYRQFVRIMDAFRLPEDESKDQTLDVSNEIKLAQELSGNKKPNSTDLKKVPKLPDEYDDEEVRQEDEDGEKKEKLSKRKMKKLTRLSVAELKQLVSRPDVVEMHDVTARDPKLLVHLKAHRNTVPVPRHWCFKRKYLQGKRGIEKQPFELPDFIKRTGIMEMRTSVQEKDDQKTLKAKMRERARPKLGKIDIDYQKLHDAFFKWQTKPRLSIHGDLYYEGKEYETKLREKKPGDLSDELRTALGMPVGPHAHKVPPPWLIAMQRYGPPPSYPSLKIPGLNAPIPEGCSFGYHAGGWGKPPVDETGKPLYGDVFGTQMNAPKGPELEIEVDKSLWGELESEESEEESEDEEEEEEEEERDETGLVTPAEGLATPSGISSIPVGIHTPDIIELRKRKIEIEMEGGETPALYQVLPEKKLDKIGGAMMASTHIYDVSAAAAGSAPTAKKPDLPGTVELALDPSELDLVDTEAMAARYEQQIREQQSHLEKEDLSDMVAEHVARQKGKRRKAQQQENKTTKKYKEFKF